LFHTSKNETASIEATIARKFVCFKKSNLVNLGKFPMAKSEPTSMIIRETTSGTVSDLTAKRELLAS
jgi:hypothetical protein